MTNYRKGDVLKHKTRNQYLRVLDPVYPIGGSIYVRNSDGAGFELDNKARWLTERYLTRAYEIHFRRDA
jgi:hypothetical protein